MTEDQEREVSYSGMPNEAMKLQAADPAAVADAADNAASKRRRRGPQLSAGAFGRCVFPLLPITGPQ